jgi:hypothetical protein
MQAYEFSNSQNELIGDLARKMNFVGILMIVGAVLSLVLGVMVLFVSSTKGRFDLSPIIQGFFLLLTGLWTRNAAQSFKRVVTTTGADIENMLGALGELRKLYTLQYWLIIIVLIAMAVIFIIGLIVGLTQIS